VTPMAEKMLRKAKPSEAADYRAAWRACSKLVPGEESDLLAKLDDLLKFRLVDPSAESLRILCLATSGLRSCHRGGMAFGR
jgi:hypothetical protein